MNESGLDLDCYNWCQITGIPGFATNEKKQNPEFYIKVAGRAAKFNCQS